MSVDPQPPAALQRGAGAMFHIEVYADTICPWCYIGTRFLHTAIKAFPGAVFKLRWQPWLIAPDIGPEGEGMRQFMETRYGKALDLNDPESPLAQAAAAAKVCLGGKTPPAAQNHQQQRIADRAAPAGGLGLLSRHMWNSAASHRLIELAGTQEQAEGRPPVPGQLGLQTQIVESLYDAYFEQEANIADEGVLRSLAEAAGVLEPEGAFRDRELGDGLVGFRSAAEARGVHGVPFFFISRHGYPGSYRLSGAQPPQVFVKAFESLLIDREALVTMLRTKVAGSGGSGSSRTPSPLPRTSADAGRKPGASSSASAQGRSAPPSRKRAASFLARATGAAPPCETPAVSVSSSMGGESSSSAVERLPGRPRKREREEGAAASDGDAAGAKTGGAAAPSASDVTAPAVEGGVVGDDDIQEAAETLSRVRARPCQAQQRQPRAPAPTDPPAQVRTPVQPQKPVEHSGSSSGGSGGVSSGSGGGSGSTVQQGNVLLPPARSMTYFGSGPPQHATYVAPLDAEDGLPVSPHKRIMLFKEGYGCAGGATAQPLPLDALLRHSRVAAGPMAHVSSISGLAYPLSLVRVPHGPSVMARGLAPLRELMVADVAGCRHRQLVPMRMAPAGGVGGGVPSAAPPRGAAQHWPYHMGTKQRLAGPMDG